MGDQPPVSSFFSRPSSLLCSRSIFASNLAIFSSFATRIPKRKLKTFFNDKAERKRYPGWGGGTNLNTALNIFNLDELKDGNLVIVSDMDIADVESTRKRLTEIGNVTNSFKVVVVENETQYGGYRSKISRTQELFPNKKVEILRVVV